MSATMSAAYRQLLDATIAHLERLQSLGVRHVPVQAETVAALTVKSDGTPQKTTPTRSVSNAASASAPRTNAPPTAQRPVTPTAQPPSFDAPAPLPSPARIPRSTLPPPVEKPLPPKLSPESKAQAFADLQQRVLACQKCPHLVAFRHSVVFGTGDPDARILFVGEAPGAEEDHAGEPFVGAAGALLTKIITAMGLSRDSVYIANILKCRPDLPPGAPGNRKPSAEEMATCTPWLHEQIDLIQPEVMVALGSTAIEGLLGGPVFVNRVRGKWHSYRGIPLMPTFHPAYLLRNEVISEKRKVWEDMLAVMERLQMPISAKQRAYFTSK